MPTPEELAKLSRKIQRDWYESEGMAVPDYFKEPEDRKKTAGAQQKLKPVKQLRVIHSMSITAETRDLLRAESLRTNQAIGRIIDRLAKSLPST